MHQCYRNLYIHKTSFDVVVVVVVFLFVVPLKSCVESMRHKENAENQGWMVAEEAVIVQSE